MSSSDRVGFEAVEEYLRSRGIAHRVLEHPATMTAVQEAERIGMPQRQVAKTVVLQDGRDYALAVVPASERVDLHRLRELLGASKQLRLATEAEIARDLPALEVGAAPPFGPMSPKAEVIDRRLLEDDEIVCAGGDHGHSVALAAADVLRLTGAITADICEP